MGPVEIGDVLAVGVVRLVRHQIPDDAETERNLPVIRGDQPAEQAELQEVTNISRVAVLHLQSLTDSRKERTGHSQPPCTPTTSPGMTLGSRGGSGLPVGHSRPPSGDTVDRQWMLNVPSFGDYSGIHRVGGAG